MIAASLNHLCAYDSKVRFCELLLSGVDHKIVSSCASYGRYKQTIATEPRYRSADSLAQRHIDGTKGGHRNG